MPPTFLRRLSSGPSRPPRPTLTSAFASAFLTLSCAGLIATRPGASGGAWLLRIYGFLWRLGRAQVPALDARRAAWVEQIIARQTADPADEVVLFAELVPVRWLGAAVDVPVLRSVDVPTLVLAIAAAVAIFRVAS